MARVEILQAMHGLLFRRLLVLALACAGNAGLANASANPSPPAMAECIGASSTTVLSLALIKRSDAKAYWLDANLVKWPGVESGENFRLYFSTDARLVAEPGKSVANADAILELEVLETPVSSVLAQRFKFVADGVVLAIRPANEARLRALLPQQILLVQQDAAGKVIQATAVQNPGLLDDLFATAAQEDQLGVMVDRNGTAFKLWAPTARQVSVCLYQADGRSIMALHAMQRDASTGIWSLQQPGDLSGKYYTYLVEVFVPVLGVVRNRVTDPYSISLNANSTRSYIAELDAAALKPPDWDSALFPAKVSAQTDMSIYELHVRDFSINDLSVSAHNRGKYLAFTEFDSDGMRHLRALSEAGLTDVHLLPVFDFATVPEVGCVTPQVPDAPRDSEAQQAAVMAVAASDCFNWGYDPYHFSAVEGSYASDAQDGARRILEFRKMVMALHRAGLRVGMDVVYNHTTTSGQHETSVLDRIVPGYYHRLDAKGVVERSTCCDNTATEHLMMGKLMIDSVTLWATQYKIDSFRFDLMGHQPRSVMEALKQRVDAATDRDINLIGEGWNFGEVAEGARFVQASQLSLNGSGIGTFSDRARDAVRGGGPSDSGDALLQRQGWINGLVYDRNASAPARPGNDLMQAADLVRVGLAGSLRDYPMTTYRDAQIPLAQIDYGGQPAGYASEPGEVVNYVENHDNQTLFDNNVYKLPVDTSAEDRARVQILGLAINAFSQGVAYFHAGVDTLRSKSMDRNSFDSGDWFNRLDWTYAENFFGSGLPPKPDNAINYAYIGPLLRNIAINPAPSDIAWTRDAFRDLLKMRASSTLFRMRSAQDILERLRFPNLGSVQNPVVIAAHLQGAGYAGAGFGEILVLINADKRPQTLQLAAERGKPYRLHPTHRAAGAADRRALESVYEPASGTFTVPARTAVVFVVE